MRVIVYFHIPESNSPHAVTYEIPDQCHISDVTRALNDVMDLQKYRYGGLTPVMNPSLEPEKRGPAPSDVQSCMEEWMETLQKMKIHRPITESELAEIRVALEKHGFELVKLAIFGARFEPASESFDPRAYLSLSRVFGKDKSGAERIVQFANWGARQKALLEERQKPPTPEEEFQPSDPAKVRQILAGAGFGRYPKKDDGPPDPSAA